jgi:hypothetical protein
MQFGENGLVKICHWGKDGGPESKVWGFWLLGIKPLFSIAVLRFDNGSREAFHSHAFNCVSLVLSGLLYETLLGGQLRIYSTGNLVVTRRDTFHMVRSCGRSWVLTFRGPWRKTWNEYIPGLGKRTLTHGRRVIQDNP